ncbi:short-chain dehydrogenase/reductase 2b-like [Carex rostrata]
MELNNKIAVVTGGNRGIGLEICKKLASNGVDVILTARNDERGKEAVNELTRDYGLTNIIFHQLDVTDPSSIESLAGFVKNQFGKLDILVNNAAIGGFVFTKTVDEKLPQQERATFLQNNVIESYEKAVECFQTNYYGVKNMMEVFLPLVQLSNFGRIVNVSAGLGKLQNLNNESLRNELMDIDNLTVKRIEDLAESFLKSVKDENTLEKNKWTSQYHTYSGSKILMNAYTRVVAKSCPSVNINCVCPGHVKTDFNFNTGYLTVSEGAEGPVMVALAEGGITGQFYDRTQISTF